MMKQNLHTARGQATLFMIVGLLIVFLIGLYFFYDEVEALLIEITLTETEANEQRERTDTAYECLEYYTEQALELLRKQGGYIELPEKNLHVERHKLAYFPQNRSSKDMEREVARYIEGKLPENCFKREEEYSLSTTGDLEISVELSENEILIIGDWPLYFTKEDTGDLFWLEPIVYSSQSSVKILFETAQELSKEENTIDYTKAYYGLEGMEISIIPFENSSIYTLAQEGEYFIFAVER